MVPILEIPLIALVLCFFVIKFVFGMLLTVAIALSLWFAIKWTFNYCISSICSLERTYWPGGFEWLDNFISEKLGLDDKKT